VKKWLKSVYIHGSYRKIKTGLSVFGPPYTLVPRTSIKIQLQFRLREHCRFSRATPLSLSSTCQSRLYRCNGCGSHCRSHLSLFSVILYTIQKNWHECGWAFWRMKLDATCCAQNIQTSSL